MENQNPKWVPESLAEHDLVKQELERVLSTSAFSNSKRYPVFLKYVVETALSGHTELLRERQIGTAIFDRPVDYDTTSDPIVRYTAGEVRRRLVSHYHEDGSASHVTISVPAGSYIPEFRRRAHDLRQESVEADFPSPTTVTASPAAAGSIVPTAYSYRRWALFAVVAFVVAGVALGWRSFERPSTVDLLWKPFLGAKGSLIVSGQILSREVAPGDRPLITLENGVSIAKLSGLFESRKSYYKLQVAGSTTLSQMDGTPTVFLNAFNNVWTMRMMQPLRYHFSDVSSFTHVIDMQNPQDTRWAIDWRKTPATSQAFTDYAIIARFKNPATNAPTLILAGMGRDGGPAAVTFVTSQPYMDTLAKEIGRSNLNKNFEVVLSLDVLNGEAGPPSILATYVW